MTSNNEALDKFWEFCKANKNEKAKEYILSRQFDENDFEWGFFPESTESEKLLKKYITNFQDLTIAAADYKGENIQTRFYNRLIFPIHNLAGELIAIAGRPIVEPVPKPKYLNSRYSKKYNLFYLNQAIPYIRKYRFVLVCEGYFAALRLHHTCGIKNVVATCGTLFTREQLDCISRYTDNIGFLRDNDEAGRSSTQSIIEDFSALNKTRTESSQLNLFQVQIDTEGDDPDDYVIKYGKEKFVNLVKSQLIIKK